MNETVTRDRISVLGPGEIWITEDGLGLADCLASRFGLLGYVVRQLGVADWKTLPAPESLAGLIILSPAHADDAFLRDSF